jgi:hypothetical protein
MDSVEGIARWWVKADAFLVGQALDELTEMKVVGKRKGISHDLYFLADVDRLSLREISDEERIQELVGLSSS